MKPRQRTVLIAKNGRMNLPSDMRRALGLLGSGRVILTQEEDGIRITTASHALKRIRELAAPFKPAEGLMSEELIAERREEAAREAGGQGSSSHG